jgi:hypothetical protein
MFPYLSEPLSNEILISELGISSRELPQYSFILLLNLSVEFLYYHIKILLNLF